MLRRLAVTCGRVASTSSVAARRALATSSGGSGEDKPSSPADLLDAKDKNKKKGIPAKDVIDTSFLDAVDAVAKELHQEDKSARKQAAKDIVSYLKELESETFKEATAAATEEMLADKAIQAFLGDVQRDSQLAASARRKAPDIRREKEGMVLLRQEMFERAVHDGFKPAEARDIAERAVARAQERINEMRTRQWMEKTAVEEEKSEKEAEVAEHERKFFDEAYELAEKMLYREEGQSLTGMMAKPEVKPDTTASLLKAKKDEKRLGIWPMGGKGLEERHLEFWRDWDLRAARIANQGMGPRNAFEEQIEWTKKGKLWPYPIDNELDLGEELNIPFYKHIFLKREAEALGIPKDGPIAHFMELVCVGLSKNPYMTLTKKMEHLQWFANYFNPEKQKLIDKLHKQEQQAAIG